MAIFSLYVVIWSCTYTVCIYCLSISVYIYSVILYYLSNDGLASLSQVLTLDCSNIQWITPVYGFLGSTINQSIKLNVHKKNK